MRARLWVSVACFVCFCLGGAWPAVTFADGSSLFGGSVVLSADPLVIVGSPDEAAQKDAGEESRRSDPALVAERGASRTAFEGLTPVQGEVEAKVAFPGLVGRPDSFVRLPAGASVRRYVTDNSAQVSLPGAIGLVESSSPLALETSLGARVPLDLSLRESGGGFEPNRAAAEVELPKNLARGVSLRGVGVSLTPVDSAGVALSATSGGVDNATVFWSVRQGSSLGVHDLGVVAKPSLGGVDVNMVLFSQRSPSTLYFRVGVPVGARLEPVTDGIRIVKEGSTLAFIPAPTARDAEGAVIPASMSLRGDLVAVVLALRGDYRYPEVVDPELVDKQLATTIGGKRSNWEFYPRHSSIFEGGKVYEGAEKERLETKGIAEYGEGEYAFWGYETKGNSKIFEFKAETEAHNKGSKIESFLELQAPGAAQETKRVLSTESGSPEYGRKALEPPLCALKEGKESCLPGSGKEKNAVHFQQSATGAPGSGYRFSDVLYQGLVSISEPAGTHSTTGFNTSSSGLEFEVETEGKKEKIKRANALYGAGSWLSKYDGALEFVAKDPGIGVSATKLEWENAGKWEQLSAHNYLENENGCQGVQCYAEHGEGWTVDPKLPNGEDKIRYRAEEAMAGTQSLESEGQATVKVDTAAPHRIVLNGLPFGNELSERAYELTGEATDGEGATVASSGIKSITLFVDGLEFGTAAGSCSVPKGECTATAKWTINGAELGAGHHAIVIEALDNAGNEARRYETLSIRHSTPVALGPGSVDLQSGDFVLGGTDVSVGSGLTVSRDYSSRDLTAGLEGPLGPQWSLSVSSTESLVEMVDGSVLLTAGNGSQTIFAKTESTTYESPPGDSNLTLKLEENKETKQKLAYYLENAADRTKVKFTLPIGSKAWVPTRQEGTVATDTVSYAYQTVDRAETVHPSEYWFSGSGPYGVASGPDGDVWFTYYGTSKIEKTPTAGGPGTGYSLPAESDPTAIVAGADGNLWFTDYGTSRVGKITTSGSITEYALPSGSKPDGITAGPDGNLWFVDYGTSKVGKITTSGSITEYALPSESDPSAIVAGPDGDLWFTDYGTSRIGKITTTGSIAEYALPSKSDPFGIVAGPDGNLWFTDYGTDMVGRIALSGSTVEYALPAGSAAHGIALGSDRDLWYADYGSSKVGKIPAPRTITEPVEALAPVPAQVSCSWSEKPTEMQAGCRALEFKYATETIAKGETESEWGAYNQQLSKVLLVAYNPATKKMEELPVAEYSYDLQGRLRAEWDPRISPELKTIYGYDEAGHVTALDPPGQEPWFFTYGTTVNDSGMGRLLKVTRAPASSELWKGEAETNTTAPQLTGSVVLGVRMAVSNGSWSGSPSYSYQWLRCSPGGLECKTILGATNQNYTPTTADVGHTLTAVVTATNGGGSKSASTALSSVVEGRSATRTVDSPNSLNAVSCVSGTKDCVISDSKGNAFYATKVSTGNNYAVWSSWTGPGTSPSEAVDCPSTSLCVMAAGQKPGGGGNLDYATSLGGTWTEAYNPTYGVDAIWCTSSSFCVDGQGSGQFRYSTSPASSSWTLESQGSANMKGVFCLSTSFCAIADGSGSVHIATTTAQVESSSWTETKVDGTNTLNGIACTSTSSCVTIDPAGNLLNLAIGSKGEATATIHNIDGTNSFTGIACTGSTCATVDNAGNVFVSTNSGENWTEAFQPGGKLQAVACASSTLCVTVDTAGNVTAFNASGGGYTEGEYHSPQPGTTIDYNVPVEGSTAPYQMGENPTTHKPETEKWGQKEDVPIEATAVIAPDSRQGWPASSYKRAAVYYMDEQGRTVNVAAPSSNPEGSIATTEYNEYNDAIRTLSPDNRLAALAAGEKSVEVSKLLDTENTYNGEGAKENEVAEPGTRLIETLGPQHMVKYMEGKEQKESLARNHMEYFYDQGVPKSEPYEKEHYNLVTETSDLAQLANREEREVRTTKTSYSGQNNLGWRLRAPTSVTIDPNGLKLTTTTLYNEATGQIEETRGTAAENTFTYASKFGSIGSESGKLNTPSGIAVDASGNLWVVDSANNRLEKFGPEGKYLSTVGEAGSEPGKLNTPLGVAIDPKGNLWVADTSNNRIEEFGPEGKYLTSVGSAGNENGKLKTPAAVALDSKGNLWVADTANNRIQEFNTEGKYVFQFGSTGSEPGKLNTPEGIAIDTEGHIWISDTNNNRVQEFSTGGTLLKHFGTLGAGEGQLDSPAGIAFDSNGDLWVADRLNNRVEAFSPSGSYITQIGSKGGENGQLATPRFPVFDAHGNAWVTDTANNRVQEYSKGPNAQDTKTIYYTSETNTEGYSNCGGHPEWSGLVCETLPAKQPELVATLPKLPVTTVTSYNIWNEPEKTEETFGSGVSAKTRTKTENYDEAGRRTSSETTSTSTEDATLPKVSFEYNKNTGVLQKQDMTVEGKEQSITSEYNSLGQLITYTDADGNIAKYKYANPENDGLLEEVSDSSNEGKSYQTYGYNETTKQMNRLVDSTAGTFTASYDPEGKLVSETYPNNMCANYGYNSTGETTSIQYIKTTNCTEPGEAPVWYSETRVPSVRGETYSQTSTLANNTYAYDTAGRLAETQETPTEQGCTTRVYVYDETGNRASLTTIKPGSKNECQNEGGTIEAHNYDEAGHMNDPGIAYDPLGNITKLPATDSEGHELINTFYADNAIATQEETEKNSKIIEQKNVYSLDPEGRTRKTIATGKAVGTTIAHYDAPGETVAWTSEESGKWTRNIPGIDGTLSATQTNSETILQLHDLHGNIIATAALNPNETKPLSTYNSTEFGVPNGKEPPKYAWLGAGGIAKALPTGVITYGATSYVPQTGRSLQSEQVEPPGIPGGSGAGAPYTSQEEPWNTQGAAREAAEAPGLEAGREREAAEAACRANPASCITEEDPHWIWMLTVQQAEQLSGSIMGAEGYLTATKLGDLFKHVAGIDFVTQLEEAAEEGVFGFSRDEVEKWALGLAEGLGECTGDALFGYGHPHDPHCWVYVVTKNYHIGFTIFGQFIGYIFEIPDFKRDAQVAYCPHGESYCYAP